MDIVWTFYDIGHGYKKTFECPCMDIVWTFHGHCSLFSKQVSIWWMFHYLLCFQYWQLVAEFQETPTVYRIVQLYNAVSYRTWCRHVYNIFAIHLRMGRGLQQYSRRIQALSTFVLINEQIKDYEPSHLGIQICSSYRNTRRLILVSPFW